MTIIGIHIITCIGIFLIGIGTLFTILGQQILTDRNAKEMSAKADEIKDLSEKNILLNQEITSLAKENANLNIELRQFVSGGDSYCYIRTYFENGHSDNIISFLVEHNGKLSII